MEQDKELEISPHNPETSEIVWKFVIWIIVWVVVVAVIFFLLIFTAWIFEWSNKSIWWHTSTVNPLIPLILLAVTFFTTVIWNIIVSWIYNVIYPWKYYDLWKMIKLVVINNILLFIIFIFLYLLFSSEIKNLYYIVWFHIIFSVFITSTNQEILSNPNYAWVHLVWTSFWLIISFLVFWIIHKIYFSNVTNNLHYLILVPPMISFTLIPLCHWIWEKIYYAFYEMGNNFLYLPSINDILVDEDEVTDTNVDIS